MCEGKFKVAAIVFFAALVICPRGARAEQMTLAGHRSCGFTDYAWPNSADDSARAGGTGRLEFEAGRDGSITSGSMTIHTADDTHTSGQNTCEFEFVSGKYEMSSESAGTSTLTWKLRPGSDAHCGAYVRNAEYLGFVASSRDFSPLTGTSKFFVARDGRSQFVAASPAGIEIGVCDAPR